MRLTPSRFSSSSTGTTGDRSTSDPAVTEVTIYDASTTVDDEGGSRRVRPADVVPESDSALLSLLTDMDSPATVDEVTDRLVDPDRVSIAEWAAVHERLHSDRLPELDDTDAVRFDVDRGLIDVRIGTASRWGRVRGALGSVPIHVLFTALALLATSLLAVSLV